MNLSVVREPQWIVLAMLFVVHTQACAQEPAETLPAEGWVALYEPHADDKMPYRLMRPLGFDPSHRYPVIVSLHGGGGRGSDNRKQLRVWNKLLAEDATRSAYPSYVLVPQSDRLWDAAHLEQIKALVGRLPSADPERIYLVGHSMGGHGAYIFLQLDPGYFAAAAPSAGTGRARDAEFIDAALIKDIPIWAFHGDSDEVCPYDRAERLFEEMERLGGNLKLTTWLGDGHGIAAKMIRGGDNGRTRCSTDRCDDDTKMLPWLFAQTLAARN